MGYDLTTSQNTGNTVTALGGTSLSNYPASAVNNLNAIVASLGSTGVIAQKLGDAGIANSLTGEAERIRSNLYEQNLNWGDGWAPSGATYIAAGAQITPYGSGGYIYGPSHAAGGVPILAEGGEYVINRRDTARFRSQLDNLNYGHQLPANDNGELLAAIRDLLRELRRNTSVAGAGAEYVREGVDAIGQKIERASRVMALSA